MVLLGVTDTARAVTCGPMESKGSLVYKFVNAQANIPIIMQNLDDPVPKVIMISCCYVTFIKCIKKEAPITGYAKFHQNKQNNSLN